MTDPTVTVRHLARSPITLDAAGVEEVPSTEPYRLAYDVAEDSLILEIRLEAPSYFTLDTVLGVPRGSTGGPYRLGMVPREGWPPRGGGSVAGGGGRGGAPGSGGGGPAPAGGSGGGAEDRSPLISGDRAFEQGDWGGAVAAYRRMPPPRDRGGEYAREYQRALVRLGIAQINLGDWQGARASLQSAVDFDFREYTAFFYLGQVQCTLGEFDAGRQALHHIPQWLTLHISEGQRPVVLALVEFQLGACSYAEASRARTGAELQRARERAVAELQSFLEKARAFPAPPPEIQAAAAQAQRMLAELRGSPSPP